MVWPLRAAVVVVCSMLVACPGSGTSDVDAGGRDATAAQDRGVQADAAARADAVTEDAMAAPDGAAEDAAATAEDAAATADDAAAAANDAAADDAAADDAAAPADDAAAPADDAAAAANDAAADDAAAPADDAAADDAAADDAAADDAAADDAAADDAAADDAAADDAAADDATAPDAAAPDAGVAPAPDRLLVFAASSLFTYDRTTGALHERGPTGYGALGILSPTYVPTTGLLHVIVDFTTAPTLATVNPCTGAVTRGARITHNGTPVPVAEGLAIDAAGTVFTSIKLAATGGSRTETVGTIDLATGAVTARGTVTSLQNDVDQLVYGDGTLYALDVATDVGQAAIYTINPTTGAATLLTATTDSLRRIVWDPVAHALVGATAASPRQLVTVSLSTGALTPTHVTHTTAQLGGELIDALALVSEQCPRELLTNFGYETPEPVCGFPSAAGDWAVDASTLVSASSGVSPFTGSAMLRFDSTGFTGSGAACGPQAGGASLDVAQLVDVSGCQPGTTLQLRGFFAASAGAGPGTATCLVRAFGGAISGFATATPLAEQTASVALDTNVATWQRCTASLALPAGTQYVAAYLAASAATPTRFADDASLRAVAGSCP